MRKVSLSKTMLLVRSVTRGPGASSVSKTSMTTPLSRPLLGGWAGPTEPPFPPGAPPPCEEASGLSAAAASGRLCTTTSPSSPRMRTRGRGFSFPESSVPPLSNSSASGRTTRTRPFFCGSHFSARNREARRPSADDHAAGVALQRLRSRPGGGVLHRPRRLEDDVRHERPGEDQDGDEKLEEGAHGSFVRSIP